MLLLAAGLRALPRLGWGWGQRDQPCGSQGSARPLARAGLSGSASRLPPPIKSRVLRRCPDAAAINSWLCLLRSAGPPTEISIILAWGWERAKSWRAPKVRGARAERTPFLPAGTARKSRTTAVAQGLVKNLQPADGSSIALCSEASASIDCSCPGKSDYGANPWHAVCSAEAALPSPGWISGIQGSGMMTP